MKDTYTLGSITLVSFVCSYFISSVNLSDSHLYVIAVPGRFIFQASRRRTLKGAGSLHVANQVVPGHLDQLADASGFSKARIPFNRKDLGKGNDDGYGDEEL